MKKRILILLLTLCICFSCMLSACNKNDSEPTGDGATKTTEKIVPSVPPEYILPLDFEDYTSLMDVFSGTPDSVIQADKALYGDILPRYKMFVDYLTETKNIMIPMWNDSALTLREGCIFRREMYKLPWIWYYSDYQGEIFIVNTTYPAVMAIDGITSDMSASDVIRLIDEDSLNLHNYRQDERIEYMYTKTLELADAEVPALIWRFKDDKVIFVSFYYKDTLVKFYNLDELLPDEFWKSFSLESVANGALNP